MLVLSRKKGEGISIGQDIVVSILDIDGDKVSIGIDAPRTVKILRQELIAQTINSNIESLKSKSEILQQFSVLKKENKK